jgi:YggT family protein
MIPILNFADVVLATLFRIYFYVVFAAVIFSWLIAFNIVNPYNQTVRMIGTALNRLTEPLLRPIRRSLPDLGGLDISPIVLLLLMFFLEYFLREVVIHGWLRPALA